MEIIDLLPYAAFGCITLLAWAIISITSGKSNRTEERLFELNNPHLRKENQAAGGAAGDSGVGGMFKKAAPTLSKALKPKTELEESDLKIRMANAGFNSQNAPTVYLAIKFTMLIVGLLLGVGIGLPLYGTTTNGLFAIIIGAGVGFYIPGLALAFIRSSRQSKIFLSMPDALDLLVVCVESGLGLDAGMRRVSEELADTAPEICSEMDLCNFQLQMGRPRRDVLHDLGIRTGVDDMRALAAILIQADKFGSSIAQALRVQSDSMRIKRMQMAEEKAQQTAVKLIFPLVLFIFPGIFVVLVGPAAILLMEGLLNT